MSYTTIPAAAATVGAGTGITLNGTLFDNNLSTGKAGGQAVIGGTAASEGLTLTSTSHATKGQTKVGTGGLGTVVLAGATIQIGTPSPTTAQVAGFGYFGVMAGTPTGIPTGVTGCAPVTLDSTGNALWAYLGGSWRNLSAGGAAETLPATYLAGASAADSTITLDATRGGLILTTTAAVLPLDIRRGTNGAGVLSVIEARHLGSTDGDDVAIELRPGGTSTGFASRIISRIIGSRVNLEFRNAANTAVPTADRLHATMLGSGQTDFSGPVRVLVPTSGGGAAPMEIGDATSGNAVNLKLINSSGTTALFLSGGVDNFVAGTAVGDSGVLLTGTKKFCVGTGATAGLVYDHNTHSLSVPTLVMGTAALATTATDGFIYLAGGAGAPTGVPTAYTGRYPMYWDTTNKKLYVYDGSWKGGTVPGTFV